MKKLLLLVLLLFCSVTPVAAGGIVVVKSLPIKPYDEALKGFKSVCRERTSTVVSSEMTAADVVKQVRKKDPSLVVAIGMDSLAKLATIPDLPIIYLMVLNPGPLIQHSSNITGISLRVQPEKQVAVFRQVLPKATRIGVLFNPEESGTFVKKAQAVAAAADVELVAKAVSTPRDAAIAFDGMKGQIDALWLLPDVTVVKPGSIELLLLSAVNSRIPVFCFSDKYTEKGALFSLDIDATETGRQAGEMANRILAGEAVQKIPKADARTGVLTINRTVARKLGIPIDGGVLKQSAATQAGGR